MRHTTMVKWHIFKHINNNEDTMLSLATFFLTVKNVFHITALSTKTWPLSII